ncbi:MAG: calcium/proton exchanger [Candidatus Tectimicrobiota bacterium]
MRLGPLTVEPLSLLLVCIPIAWLLELLHANPVWIFVVSALAIIPLAGHMGHATEQLAERTSPGVGGFLNATFGNAAELIIAIMALRQGLHDVVKASLTGSIIGNILLVLGLSALCGGLRYERQTFNATAAGLGSTLLVLSAIGLLVPSVFHQLVLRQQITHERELSVDIAIILFITYLLSLVFSLRTHKHLYGAVAPHHAPADGTHPAAASAWSVQRAVTVLVLATVGVAVMSELLVGAVEHTAKVFGMTEVFVGVILVAIIGNAAEHSTAILVAMKNQMDLALNIAVGSSAQVALFVAPLLVFLSYLFGEPMDLLFTRFEVVAVALSVWVLSLMAQDGETHWMEGVQLLALYAILGVAFYFLPAS